MESILQVFATRGDLAHLALAAWALSASGVALAALGGLSRANERIDAFVRELARFNARHDDP
ncbi:hypothetical protein [Azorhizobium caulinodans]|uniref:Uncharacterized protein n=1 Tax=Azorhizobium caulinodans (strain ATCC 43989 / DSM 5975 / JCM 20966 / LMG 6465 / NBRC 14845 / NCIMB 13405 / ORS 571) TaxID=438753 RepID=A8HR31_AZOC5|nr:hypothetical protein [Azorhizobium caulinodans]BAF87108.1 hypothetical protein AZC_1110 [Azorhizobium caulinodans ORS 571]